MEYYAEVKVMGDAYGGGFSNGLTMCGSQSAAAFHKVEDRGEDAVYDDDRQHRIVLHKKTVGQAVEVSTEFMNDSPEAVTLEMLSSFAVKGISADRIHRLQSFWSAEGKLRTETIEELHLEPSWNRCGMRVEKFGNVGSMPVRKYFPFLAAEDSKRQEFLGIQLYCPSSWQIELLCKEDDTLTIAGGIADRDFGHWTKKVGPGERFETPKEMCIRDRYCMVFRSRNSFTVNGDPYQNGILRISDTNAGESSDAFTLESGFFIPTALCEMFIHRAKDTIWVQMGMPDEWKTCSCRELAVEGGHRITSEREDYSIRRILLKAGCEETLTLRWKDDIPVKRVMRNGTEMEGCKQKSLTLEVLPGEEYVIEFE